MSKLIKDINDRLDDDKLKSAKEKYRLARQLDALKTLVASCSVLETHASSYFKPPEAEVETKISGLQLADEVQSISSGFKTCVSYDWMKLDMKDEAAELQAAINRQSNEKVPRSLPAEEAKAVFFQHLAALIKIVKLAQEATYDEIARAAAKLPLPHRVAYRIVILSVSAALIAFIAVLGDLSYSRGTKKNTTAPTESSASVGDATHKNLPKAVPGPDKGTASNAKDKVPDLTLIALLVIGISAFLATLWAIQSYWRLAIVDREDKWWHPPETDSDWSGPYTFHALAQSHKEWAQLWFSWCVAIFLGGVTYAVYNSAHSDKLPHGDWPEMLLPMLNSYLHHGLVYALFGFSWYWASKHYRSHWHNYVANAYRHRSLYRFEILRREIPNSMIGETAASKIEANKTILDLFRLSGILLLIPGESSYLDKPAGEEVSKAILRMEEVANAFSHRGEGGGKH